MPKFRGIRHYTMSEEVEVEAKSKTEALDKFNDDAEDVKVLTMTEGDYEADYREIYEVRGEFGTIVKGADETNRKS